MVPSLAVNIAKLALIAGALCAAGTSPASAQARKVKFAADWAFQGPQAPFLVPHEDGCYQKASLDVTTDRGFGSGDTVTKVAAGAYDIGFADINAMAEFNARNPNTKLIGVFMIYDASGVSIITRKDAAITKPADLVGKTIAAPSGDASRRLFPMLAKASGFDPTSVKWNNVSPEIRETMLAKKNTDAISGAAFTAYVGVKGAGLPEKEVVVLRYSEYGVPLYGSALIVKADWAAANASTLTAFIGCVADGIKTSYKYPDKAIDALAKRDPLVDKKLEMERMVLSYDWSIATPWAKKNGMGNVDQARLAKSLEGVALAFDIPVPAAQDIFTDKYLPPRDRLVLAK